MAGPTITPRKLPRQKRAQETVEVILEATRRVLVRRGYQRAGTAEIARLAGVSIGSLYQYFPSKEALVSALSRRHSERMLAVFRQRIEQSRALPLREAIRLIIQTEMEALQQDPVLLRVLFEHVPRFGNPDHIIQVQAQVIDMLGAEIRARPELLEVHDPALCAFLIVYAVEGICQAALQHRPDLLTSPGLLEQCTELVVHHLQGGPTAGRPDRC